MTKIVLYSTGCPKCTVLKKKMNLKGLQYQEITDIEEIKQKGLKSVPWLCVNDTEMMDFAAANKWLNSVEVTNGDN